MALEKQSKQTDLSIDEAYAYLVHRTARLLRFHFLRMAADNGIELTPEQWFILNRLRKQSGLTQTELADSIFKDRANITRILNSMEGHELVERRSDAEDKRVYRVFLTDRGRRVHDQMARAAAAERKTVYRGLNKNDFKELKRILDVIDANIIAAVE